MNYSQVLNYLYEQLPMFQRQGPVAFKKDLGNIKKLCHALGDPHQHQKFIHIAGTNGKGSTAHILASILQANGLNVGLYTSPHYKDFRERIKINGRLIPKRSVTTFINKHKPLFKEIQPSFFEITMALAFWYFKKKKVDVAIIETGLGGRLDSTNIIQPLISIITNISLDHQNMLGNTLKEIAREKAGIIKPNTPVLIGQYQRNVVSVFRDKAKNEKAPIYFSKDIIAIQGQMKKRGGYTIEFSYPGNQKLIKATTDISGNYQLQNLQTALAAIHKLERINFLQLKITQLKLGLKNIIRDTYFLGRWMRLSEKPLIIADSAHNLDGVKSAMHQLNRIEYEQLHIVFGTVKDKDPADILKLLPEKGIYYFAKADIPRGMDAETLAEKAERFNLIGKAYASVEKAFDAAKKAAGIEDLIYVGGSIFVVAEVV